MASSQGQIHPITKTAVSPSTGTKPDWSFSSSARDEQPADSSTYHQRLRAGNCSDTIIVPRHSPYIEIQDEEYGDDDARTMSPRRGSEEIEVMCEQARNALDMQKSVLREKLLKIGGCIESIKSEQNKLEDGSRFLQLYIGEVIQRSK